MTLVQLPSCEYSWNISLKKNTNNTTDHCFPKYYYAHIWIHFVPCHKCNSILALGGLWSGKILQSGVNRMNQEQKFWYFIELEVCFIELVLVSKPVSFTGLKRYSVKCNKCLFNQKSMWKLQMWDIFHPNRWLCQFDSNHANANW